MSAVWMRLRSEIRTRWRTWLGLALLIGLAGAAAVAAAAGARRTETAYPRFVQAQNGYDLITGGSSGNIDPGRALARIEALPEVAQWARIDVAASSAILPSGRVAPAPELMAATDLSLDPPCKWWCGGGVSTRKVPSELGRWELLKPPRSGLRGHLASAIVTRAGQDPREVR